MKKRRIGWPLTAPRCRLAKKNRANTRRLLPKWRGAAKQGPPAIMN
jgi:hypothetical protein